jgi:hypothetical protein
MQLAIYNNIYYVNPSNYYSTLLLLMDGRDKKRASMLCVTVLCCIHLFAEMPAWLFSSLNRESKQYLAINTFLISLNLMYSTVLQKIKAINDMPRVKYGASDVSMFKKILYF